MIGLINAARAQAKAAAVAMRRYRQTAKNEARAKELARIKDMVRKITYKPEWLLVVGDDGNRFYLQVAVTKNADAAVDAFSGKRAAWRGSKRYVSPHMCDQELVGIAFDLFKAAELHEMHEWFKYRGRAIYCPHLSPDSLWEIATLKHMDVRQDAMLMRE